MYDILIFAQTYIIPFLLVLSVLVFVHEFGHFWVARKCGVRVEIFSIGFGPEIFGRNDKHGTRWKFSLIPLGGYVKMFGDTDPASAGVTEEVKQLSPEERKYAFFSKSVAQRAAIVFAGPAVNYIFAAIILAGLFATQGQPYTPTTVSEVVADSAASQAGLMVGDHITAIGDTKIERFEELQRIIKINTGTPEVLTIQRAGIEQKITVTPRLQKQVDRFGQEHNIGLLGIMSKGTEYRDLSIIESVSEVIVECYSITVSSLQGIGQIIMGTRASDELGGPIRIAQMSGQMAGEGWLSLVWFMAMLSINLGLINLFPLPLLDGGHLVFYAYEAVRGKPLDEKVMEYGFRFGFVLLISLMIFATWNDLTQLRVFHYLAELVS